MADETDEVFVSIAVEKGYLSAEQVEQCRQAVKVGRAAGFDVTVFTAIRDRKLLLPAQVNAIKVEMHKRGVLPRLGGYELLAKLGEGGMGAVYKARQLSLNRLVALKVLPPELCGNPILVERFRREAQLAAKLSHPNAVHVFDFREDAGRYVIAMEYVEGESLKELMAGGPLAEKRALRIIRDVALALDAAHGQGILHRDVKPANILLTRQGEAKLADLGIAKQIGVEGQTLTRTGAGLGTPQYMSPEQCRGDKAVDCRADIYSLGATLFHLVCGRPPYTGGTTAAILHAQVYDPLPDPRGINPAVSEGVCGLIACMMAKDPDQRLPTCAALVRKIEILLQPLPDSSGADSLRSEAAGGVAPAEVAEAVEAFLSDRAPSTAIGEETVQRLAPPTPTQTGVVRDAALAAAPTPVEAVPAVRPARRRGARRKAVMIGSVVVAVFAIAAVCVFAVEVLSRQRADAQESQRQARLLAAYEAKRQEAESLEQAQKWKEAEAAWVEAQSLGNGLSPKPGSLAGVPAKLVAARAQTEAQVAAAARESALTEAAKEAKEKEQTRLLLEFNVKTTEARSMQMSGKWGEAIAAWQDAERIAGNLDEKPATASFIPNWIAGCEKERSQSQAPTPPRVAAKSTSSAQSGSTSGNAAVAAAEAARAKSGTKATSQAASTWRVPHGFHVLPGASAEPYSKTGLPREIVHSRTGIMLAFVPAGTYTMGTPNSEQGRDRDEGPQFSARIDAPFYMGKYEVTQAEWIRMMVANPSHFRGNTRLPVEQVSWNDCQVFLAKAGNGLRLPTEIEWESACRGERTTAFSSGATSAALDLVAWYRDNSGNTTHPVGAKAPNGFGLYDMHGNVGEWCQNVYGGYPYTSNDALQRARTGVLRAQRGGSWMAVPSSCRSGARIGIAASRTHYGIGFRVAVSAIAAE